MRSFFRAQASRPTTNLLALGRRSRPLSRRLEITQTERGQAELVLQDGRRVPLPLVLQAAQQRFDQRDVTIGGRPVRWADLSPDAQSQRLAEMVYDEGLAAQLWSVLQATR